jgi:hypothetical protein
METLDILPNQTPISTADRQALAPRTKAIAAVSLIVAAGLIATSLIFSHAGRAGQATADGGDAGPELRAAEIRAERSGIWQHYELQY